MYTQIITMTRKNIEPAAAGRERTLPVRSEFIHIRLTPEEKGVLSMAAIRSRKTVSELVRSELLPAYDRKLERAS
jgi:uncharacterized protein (DUF1778 family)